MTAFAFSNVLFKCRGWSVMFYIHNVPGRVRIKTDVLRKNSGAADEIRKALSVIRGIGTVDINLTTGSILIHYNYEVVSCEEIVRLFENRGFFNRARAITNDEYFRERASRFFETLLMSAMAAR
jgi:copper chaperone CopZ